MKIRNAMLYGLLSSAVMLTGCSGEPSASDARQVVLNVLHMADKEAELTDFAVVDSNLHENGRAYIYEVEFQAELPRCMNLTMMPSQECVMLRMAMITNGPGKMPSIKLKFVKTDNGWRGEDGEIY